jgi:Peptidase family M3
MEVVTAGMMDIYQQLLGLKFNKLTCFFLLQEYFPMEVVTAGMMDIYQQLLGLKFNKLSCGEVWHEDVELWQVDDAQSGENLGKEWGQTLGVGIFKICFGQNSVF